MSIVGYARGSTTDQDLDLQLAALKASGLRVMPAPKKRSGTSTAGRAELWIPLGFVRKGDVLTVTVLTGWRLASPISPSIVRELEAKGAALKAIEQPIDTSTAAGWDSFRCSRVR